MRMKNAIMLMIVAFAAMFVLSACRQPVVCGNGVQEIGEYSTNCCADAGCPDGYACTEKGCVPDCGECQYFDSEQQKCVDQECCSNSDCDADQECEENKCIDLDCGSCEYVSDHQCKGYECCSDRDCDDDDVTTVDKCNNPSTKSSECKNIEIETCNDDEDCDDSDASTEDVCVMGSPNECVHMEIEACRDGDGYCPADCSYSNDDDCEGAGCDGLDCFTSALEDCDEAQYNMVLNLENTTVDLDAEIYLEIVSYDEDEDICEVLFRLESADVDFSGAYKDELEADGYSDDEIDEMEDTQNDDLDDDFEMEEGTCDLDSGDRDDLIDILTDWEAEDFNTADIDFDCSGDFFDWEVDMT